MVRVISEIGGFGNGLLYNGYEILEKTAYPLSVSMHR